MRESMNLTIGPWTVKLLPKSVDVAESELRLGASAATLRLVDAAGSPARKSELLRSRWFLRSCFGLESEPERSVEGDLLWSTGVCGSVSHKKGHIAGVAITSGGFFSIGLDLEQSDIPEPIVSRIVTTEELSSLSLLGTKQEGAAAGFAAKEAIFKAIFPLTRQRFWFEDAILSNVSQDVTDNASAGGQYTLSAMIGPRAGGPGSWDRQCTVFMRRILIEDDLFWLAVCGINDACFDAKTHKL